MKTLFAHRVPLLLAGLSLGLTAATAQSQDQPTPFVPSQSSRPNESNAVSAENRDPLYAKVEEAIALSKRRYLTGNVHTPWQILHGVLAYKGDFLIKSGDQKVSALEWMSQGQTFRGEPWFQKTRFGGQAHKFTEAYAFEGHPNQFLAVLANSELPLDHEFMTPDGAITVSQMIDNAQAEVNDREEVTWTLWALSHYLPPNATWKNQFGESWSIERLVRIQTLAPTQGAACGGTHGMFALSYARNRYVQTGKPLYGTWFEADQKIRKYIEVARSLQNSDGTFSDSFFAGRARADEFSQRLATSGHTLEFVVTAVPQSRLNEIWVRKAVEATADDLITHAKDSARVGPLYHALSGRQIYRMRVEPGLGVAQTKGPEERTTAKPITPLSVPEPAQE